MTTYELPGRSSKGRGSKRDCRPTLRRLGGQTSVLHLPRLKGLETLCRKHEMRRQLNGSLLPNAASLGEELKEGDRPIY